MLRVYNPLHFNPFFNQIRIMIINNYSDFQPIGCYQPITCTGTNGYLVNNPHGEYSLLLIAFDMGDVPANLIVDTAIGKVPLEMKIYMDRPSEILPRVIDCGIEETDKGHKAWMVLDVTEGHAYTSLWMYSLRNRNRNPKVKDLLEPLSSFVSEVECIESYLNGGGIYDLWAGIILILQKDGRIHFHLDRINLACFPNQGLSNINKEQLCGRALGSLAPETWTSCYDHRADIFSLARCLAYFEQRTFWKEKKLPLWNLGILEGESHEEALRRSCNIQIDKGLEGVKCDVLEKAFAFNPDERYQTLSEFLKALV